jgi:transcriptional regulator with XRE-family HTH domain
METFSDRLKKLRKDKGITQAKLAELLHLTDKAISKWESGEGNPDIGSLPAIAEIFDVSVDYLLTGKRPEKNQLVMDGLLFNMKDEQRIFTILENDDWDAFVKFGYDKLNPLVRLPPPHPGENKLNPVILKAMYQFESKKVFSNLIKVMLSSKDSYRGYESRLIPIAALVAHHMDNFVKMCALTENIDALKTINFSDLVIEEVFLPQQDKLPIKNQYDAYNNTYYLKTSTFKFLFESNLITSMVREFISSIQIPQRLPSRGATLVVDSKRILMNDLKLTYLYEFKHEKLLLNLFEKINNNLDEIIKINEQKSSYSHIDRIFSTINVFDGFSYLTLIDLDRYDHQYPKTTLLGVIQPLTQLQNKVTSNLDNAWIRKINDYHKKISMMTHTQKYFDARELKLFEMKANPKVSEEEILFFTYTNHKLTDFRSLFVSLIKDDASLEQLHNAISQAKKLYELYSKTSFVNYLEYFVHHLENKNYKELFEFSTTYEIDSLKALILNQQYDQIKQASMNLFFVSEDELKNKGFLRGNKKLTSKDILSFLNQRIPIIKNNIKIFDLIEQQFRVFGIRSVEANEIIKESQRVKKEILDAFIFDLQNRIESITGALKIKEEFELIEQSLTNEYFQNLLKKSNFDTFIIKIVVKLESKLKYYYHLTGDFKEMLDNFISKYISLEMITDDEDNRYASARDNEAQKAEIASLLNQVRMIRNSLVHSSPKQSMLSQAELIKVLSFVDSLKGE